MITLNKISKQYHMGSNVVNALDGVNLEISTGEFVAIIGPSGSGKSTLMNIIGCLDSATEGTYILNSIPITQYKENQLAEIRNRQIGFVFQQFNLLPHLTAAENVELPLIYARLPKTQRKKRAAELLSLVGLEDRMNHRPMELSGGQQQRVSIARALSNNPAILLADEPTGALDSKSGQDIMRVLKELNESGKTILLITHDAAVAANANRIITIKDGRIESDVENRRSVHA